MDYDRRSAVSSFYGARKSSDALNADFPSPEVPFDQSRHTRADSASSFYNPNRASRAGTETLGGVPNAGYNRSSFFQPGRVEPLKGGHDEESMLSNHDDAFDIYADFNNQGPRYSTAFVRNDAGYRQVPSPSPFKEEEPSTPGPVELVTVPALGPEWKASELHEMTSKAKRERRVESFSEKWSAWNRGETGMCGPYVTRKTTVYVLFGLCIVIGVILAFTIPRVPSIYFPSTSPLSKATAPFNESVPVIFSETPANFSFPANVDLQFDTSANFIPIHISKMEATVYDLTTGMLVGTGSRGGQTLPAKAYPMLQIPLNFTYIATNNSDITWNNFYDACRNPALNVNNTRPPLQFNLDLQMTIVGLVGTQKSSAAVTEANCPITLPQNAP